MSKKIAIMTWYTYKNYGSVLQASALCNVVKNVGYMPFVIQYLPKGIVSEKNMKYLVKKSINKIKNFSNPLYTSSKQKFLFDDFIKKNINQTNYCSSYVDLYDLNATYDAFICGSDQIWSPLCYDSKYFLDFVENPNKMLAYAPSFGTTEITNPLIRKQIATYISRFKYLSVREQKGADLINSLTGKVAKVVLDPTLLMDSLEWDEFIKEDKMDVLKNKEYIICYFLGNSDKYMGYVKKLSREMKIPFYVIPVTIKQKKCKSSVPFEVGPYEFVSLIRNAKYVCTDSFHGLAFAINYNIPFSVFKRFKDNDPNNQNSRIFNLLQTLGLENRLVNFQNNSNLHTEIDCDFSNANIKLFYKRKESINYLKNALENVVCFEDKLNHPFKITDMCCGCGACASVCNKGAISITKNAEGFEHYSIDFTKCVRCGMCKNVCPMINNIALDMKKSRTLYSIKSQSEETLRKSSSGGIGHELASYLIDQDFAICGCMYDISTNVAKHIWIRPEEKVKLSFLQGSKYIQSVTSNALNQIVEIASRKKIAFFGTPCQAAAVDKLLRKKNLRDKAIIIDLVCHGVPSYYLWEKYLDELTTKYGMGSHPFVLFRNKECSWSKRTIQINGNGQIYKNEENKDDFYAFFRRGLCNMKSCFDCPYRECSAADLRIGDYWGDKFKKDKQGVSMVIANTSFGEHIIELLKKNQLCHVEVQNLEEYWTIQYPYNPQKPLIREQLIDDLKSKEMNLHALRKKYCMYYDQVEKLSKLVIMIKKIVKKG